MTKTKPFIRNRADLDNRNRREPVLIRKLPTSRFAPRQVEAV